MMYITNKIISLAFLITVQNYNFSLSIIQKRHDSCRESGYYSSITEVCNVYKLNPHFLIVMLLGCNLKGGRFDFHRSFCTYFLLNKKLETILKI